MNITDFYNSALLAEISYADFDGLNLADQNDIINALTSSPRRLG